MKKEKILTFEKGKPLDLTEDVEFGCNVIIVGDNKFTMRDFREQFGHNDSLPYTGILCCNGKPICRSTNDGWGGESNIEPLDQKSAEVLSSITDELKNYKWKYGSVIITLRLDFIADTLAETEYRRLAA